MEHHVARASSTIRLCSIQMGVHPATSIHRHGTLAHWQGHLAVRARHGRGARRAIQVGRSGGQAQAIAHRAYHRGA